MEKSIYGVYDENDNCIVIGDSKEIAKGLGVKVASVHRKILRDKKNEHPNRKTTIRFLFKEEV